MDNSVVNIIKNFKNEGTLLVAGKRNTIKTFPYQELTLNIKSFRIPIFLNGFIYRYFRKSKAQRSYEFAKILLNKNIGTPKPIGYYENKNLLRLLDSYYVCEHIYADYVFGDLFGKANDDLENILKQLAQFCFKMHEEGIEFKDHSPGNTLIKKSENGKYQFFLIDLNRMNFHEEMSFQLRMKNLCRLTPSEYMVEIISHEYARLINKDKNFVFNALWTEVILFHARNIRKKRLKKTLLFWKK